MEFKQKCIFFIILIFPNVLLAKNCKKMPPFLNRLRDGVDITKLDLLPLDISSADGFRYPVFDFSCDLGITKILNGVKYDIPDQVWSIVNTPSGWLNSNIEILKTTHAVKKSMARKVDVGIGKGMFSASSSYETFNDVLTNSSKFIEEVTSYTSGYKVNMMPDWALQFGRVAKMYLERFLPQKFDSSTYPKYMKFIKTFGTHYFSQGKFGGLIRLVLTTDKSYYKGRTDTQVKAQASATFFKIIKLGGGWSSSRETVDSKFTGATQKSVRYYGGSTNLLATGGISAWQPSVVKDPWLFGGSLTEISGMIADDKKRLSMKRAIEVYTDKAYLREFLPVIGRILNHRGFNDYIKGIFKNFKAEVNKFLKQALPNHYDVVNIKAYIQKKYV